MYRTRSLARFNSDKSGELFFAHRLNSALFTSTRASPWPSLGPKKLICEGDFIAF